MKKPEFQVSELDQLKLKIVILHDDCDDEIHMTQPVGFVAADLISVDSWAFISSLEWTTYGLISSAAMIAQLGCWVEIDYSACSTQIWEIFI